MKNASTQPQPTALAPETTTFLQRYGTLFGREQALVLKMAGMASAEASAQGAWVTSSDGRRWLDFGSFGLHLLGHRHPDVIRALTTQIGRLGLSTKILPNEAVTDAADQLRHLVGRPQDMVQFANSGSEAVEAALKLARIATGRSRVVALNHGYHGRTAGALALSFGYRRATGLAESASASFVEPGDTASLEQLMRGGEVAAVIAEPVQGEGGIRPVDLDFLAATHALCEQHGSIMIHDEIQSGLGRSGRITCGAPSDILLLGKTLGGGMFPVAAAVYDRRKFGAAARDPVVHASSYSGSALAGAIASAVVGIVGEPDFCKRVETMGQRARALLIGRLGSLPGITDVRGRGLMLGVEFARRELLAQTVIECARRGLMTAFCLTATNVLRVYPPAVITDDDLVHGIDLFCDACYCAAQELNVSGSVRNSEV